MVYQFFFTCMFFLKSPLLLSMSFDDKLPLCTQQKVSGEECAICFEIMTLEQEKKDRTVLLSCNHKFHSKCIATWCNKNNSCPICRKQNIAQEIIENQTVSTDCRLLLAPCILI